MVPRGDVCGRMDGSRLMTRLLPRLFTGDGRATAAGNAAGFLGVGVAAAALAHLLAYHVAIGVPVGPGWAGAALTLLVRSPMGGLLAVAGVIATLALLLIGYEVWRLEHLTGTLARVLRAHHIAPPTDTARSRAPGRLVLFVAALLGVQVALVGLVGALCPMPITMVMNGVPMAMPGAPPLPLAPVHLLVAIVLGMFLWRVEHRLTRLRAVVTRQRRLLAAACVTRAPLAPPRTARLPRACHGLTLFARPPPWPAAPSLA